jgi:hypothetical protein
MLLLLQFLRFCISALGIAAAGADEAAFLIDKEVATIRALPGLVLG